MLFRFIVNVKNESLAIKVFYLLLFLKTFQSMFQDTDN